MTASPLDPAPANVAAGLAEPTSPLDVEGLRERVQVALIALVDRQRPILSAISEDFAPVTDSLAGFLLGGGKRIRAGFCYWGWRGAGGADIDEAVRAAAALELVHACALIHDDVMDGSDTRRGEPSVHRQFASRHAAGGWRGDPDNFGRAAAILLGNLCLIWADDMLGSSGLPAQSLLRAMPVYDTMRAEVMAGQYLDVLEQASGGQSVDAALRVARYKSAKYTVERPLHLGATLAGGSPEIVAAYTAFGIPLGEAFQLRDDVLGVFGDPAETGKPAGDDLREGKRTVLVAAALERATPAQRELVDRHLGDPQLDGAGVEALRDVIATTGALATVESLITELTASAITSLGSAPITDHARSVLLDLAVAATTRSV